MSDTKNDVDLTYAATSRCPCGAGLAYGPNDKAWDCSDILTGRAVPSGQDGAVEHTDRLPFAFYEIKSENQPSANGATTRPRPLTDAEALQRSALAAVKRCEALSRAASAAKQKFERLWAEYVAAETTRDELMERAFGAATAPAVTHPEH